MQGNFLLNWPRKASQWFWGFIRTFKDNEGLDGECRQGSQDLFEENTVDSKGTSIDKKA